MRVTATPFTQWERSEHGGQFLTVKNGLRIHDAQEWPDFYTAEHIEDRRKFFDHFLPVKYNAEGALTLASFLFTATERTEIIGYPKVKLWVEAEGHDDMDVFVSLYKLDKNGNLLQQFVIPNHCARNHDLTDRGGSILRYKGSTGRLRVSMRHLDETKSTDEIPYHSFDRSEKLKAGEIVSIEIEMYPTGIILYGGEQLRLVISATDEAGSMMPGTEPQKPNNKGIHIIHCGGIYDSYLQLPFKI